MTKQDFAAVMGYIATAVGKELGPDPESVKNRLRVYYDLLGDLDPNVFLAAAKAALLSSDYPTIPTPGALRKQATRIMSGPEITAPEAWEQVVRVLNAPSVSRERLRDAMHPRARRAAECIGWSEIGQATNGSIIRSQYQKTFETLSERDERERLLPPAARQVIEGCFRMPALLPAPQSEQTEMFK